MEWNKVKCQEESLKYNSRKKFQIGSASAYGSSLKNKWLDSICSHMIEGRKTNGYWTKEKCQEESLKYKYRSDFKKNSNVSYQISLRNKWLDEICSHMGEKIKPNGFWTFEKCKEESLKYKYRMDFQKNSAGCYLKSYKNKWLDKICSHMLVLGSKYKRCIYVYKFDDNSVYVGLTYNINKRNVQHLNCDKSQVFRYIKKTKLIPILEQLTGYINVHEAKIKEKDFINFYKNNNYKILNKMKSGGIGSTKLIWTKKMCLEEALKYNVRSEFQKHSSAAYNSSYKNGWLDETCSHMIQRKKPKGYWTKEKCYEESRKYKTKTDFKLGSCSAYKYSCINKWLNEICNHM